MTKPSEISIRHFAIHMRGRLEVEDNGNQVLGAGDKVTDTDGKDVPLDQAELMYVAQRAGDITAAWRGKATDAVAAIAPKKSDATIKTEIAKVQQAITDAGRYHELCSDLYLALSGLEGAAVSGIPSGGDFKPALVALDRAVAAAPDHPVALITRTMAHASMYKMLPSSLWDLRGDVEAAWGKTFVTELETSVKTLKSIDQPESIVTRWAVAVLTDDTVGRRDGVFAELGDVTDDDIRAAGRLVLHGPKEADLLAELEHDIEGRHR